MTICKLTFRAIEYILWSFFFLVFLLSIVSLVDVDQMSGSSTPRQRNSLTRLDTLTLAYDQHNLLQSELLLQTPTSSIAATSSDPTERLPANYDPDYESRFQHHQQQHYEHNPGNFPPEIISLIIQHLYFVILPPPNDYPNPDPHLEILPPPSTSFSSNPIFAPTPREEARLTFTRLALVDRTWGLAATDFLWKSVGFGIPRAFESVLRTIEEYTTGRRISRAERLDLAGSSGWSFESMGMTGPIVGSPEERGRGSEWSGDNKWGAMSGPFGSEAGNSGFSMIRESTAVETSGQGFS